MRTTTRYDHLVDGCAAELKVYRKAASIILELNDDPIETEVKAGRLVEVKHDEQG